MAAPRPTRASQVARWLVVEMVLWPGLLMVGVTAVLAWQFRGVPWAWPLLMLATALSLWVARRQWGTMLRAARATDGWLAVPREEAFPRPTGRGATAAPSRTRDADTP